VVDQQVMTHPNLDLIKHFFEAYGRRDLVVIQQVLVGDVVWTF
jgi:ketosteroid isomerase-like protein